MKSMEIDYIIIFSIKNAIAMLVNVYVLTHASHN